MLTSPRTAHTIRAGAGCGGPELVCVALPTVSLGRLHCATVAHQCSPVPPGVQVTSTRNTSATDRAQD